MKLLHKVSATLVTLALSCAASQLSASPILIDRGLPTANLNNAAGALRSNVSWAYGSYPVGSPYAGDWLVGDGFTNTSANTYFIDSIRLWTTGDTSNADLFGGLAGSTTYESVSTTYSMTQVTYGNGDGYQVPSGAFTPIYQLDFAVNLTLGAGETYNFFLNGDRNTSPYIPFLHASNAALSGSTQQGSDGVMLGALLDIGATTIPTENLFTWTSQGNGWDKASDVNVQVFGTVPDSGTTAMLLGLGLLGLGAARRRKA